MRPSEQVVWDYVDQESDELTLQVLNNVINDGFAKGRDILSVDAEVLALKVLSQAMVKVLALMTEKVDVENLAVAYMKLVPMHAELLKHYLVKDSKRRVS